jgi:hypothetical protein
MYLYGGLSQTHEMEDRAEGYALDAHGYAVQLTGLRRLGGRCFELESR